MNISAVIPTYNRREQVTRAIDSVLAQTTPVNEILIVDDGSTDGTAEALRRRYGSQISIFRQENAGVSAARNRGLREAHSEWVAFLDSDDLWFPPKIARQVAALGTLGDEFGVCFTNAVYDENSQSRASIFEEYGFTPATSFGEFKDPMGHLTTGRMLLSTPSLLVRRALLAEIGFFDEGLQSHEDTDVLFRLGYKTKFCFVAEPLVAIDRSPSREVTLSKLFISRNDEKHRCLQRLYGKWCSMPEVASSPYHKQVQDLWREAYYTSIECKIHTLRFGAAIKELRNLRVTGENFGRIPMTLLFRKLRKICNRGV